MVEFHGHHSLISHFETPPEEKLENLLNLNPLSIAVENAVAQLNFSHAAELMAEHVLLPVQKQILNRRLISVLSNAFMQGGILPMGYALHLELHPDSASIHQILRVIIILKISLGGNRGAGSGFQYSPLLLQFHSNFPATNSHLTLIRRRDSITC